MRLEPTTAPPWIPKGLASVETLDLQSKRLTTLRAGDFDGLTSLQGLFLSRNRLTAFPAGAFDA